MMDHALQTKGLLHIVEAEVCTKPHNTKFILALMLTVRTTFTSKNIIRCNVLIFLQFTAAWVRYRSHCYEKATLVVLPPVGHHPTIHYPPLLPDPQEFTAEFRQKLQNLINDHTYGWGLLHKHTSDPDVISLPNSSAPAPHFVWFGNVVLKEIVQRALYDPEYPGWFGFLEDVRMTDGRRFWAPLYAASPRQAGQVLGWVSTLALLGYLVCLS